MTGIPTSASLDDLAAILWRTEAVDVGAPSSVAAGRTREAFDEQTDSTKETWRKFARAARCALIPPSRADEAMVPTEIEPIGWAYQDERWDKGHWHLCGLDSKPRSSESRKIEPVYLATSLTALSAKLAEVGRERDRWMALFDSCRHARDAAGFIGSVPECIEALDGEVKLATGRAETAEHALGHEIAIKGDLVTSLRAAEAEATDLRRKLEEARKALWKARNSIETGFSTLGAITAIDAAIALTDGGDNG